MSGDIALVAVRHIIMLSCFWLPAQRRKNIERWLRGREEFKKLARSDWVLVSWGKSGRTWLRVMLSRVYQLEGNLPASQLLDFDNLKRSDPKLPAVFFTHNNYLRNYTGISDSISHFQGKRIVLLVRDPRDVAVSQYFQWKYRMRPNKKFINDYPPHGAEVDIWDFVTSNNVGVPRIVGFFNEWARSLSQMGEILVIRYEDMRSRPAEILSQVLAFSGTSARPDQIDEAVEFAAFENMKKMEQNNFFKGSGGRVTPGDKNNPQSFKVRKAKVGGFASHFSEQQCFELEGMLEHLDPIFGYTHS